MVGLVALVAMAITLVVGFAPLHGQASALTPGAINLGAVGPSVPVAPPVGSMLRNIDRDAGISVRLSDGKSLWMFADTTLFLGTQVAYFSGRGTGAIGDAGNLAVVREPVVPYGYLLVPASGLIAGGAITCPPGMGDFYWPTSAVAVPLGGGRDRVLLYYAAVCGTAPDLATYRTMSMGIAEYIYNANDPPSPSNPIVAHVQNASLFPPMPGHVQPGTGYGAASFLRNGTMYVYGCHYSPSFQDCTVAKTTPALALSSNGYTYWDGVSWSNNPNNAVDMVMPSSLVGIKGSVAYVAGLNKYVFADNDHPNAQMAVRFADRPQGPWTAPTMVPLPDCAGRKCRAGELHSQSSDATGLTLSYYVEGVLPSMRLVRAPVLSSPFGAVDAVQPATPTTININGWALDPDTTAPISVAVYIDGAGIGWFPADRNRPDIAAAFPGYGPSHGFDINLAASPGTHNVCVYAINSGAGAAMGNPLLSCRTTTLLAGNPIGIVDHTGRAGPNSINVAGWAFDPDVATPVSVAVYLDGVAAANALADLHRPDIAHVFPGYGPEHGFNLEVAATPGTHNVCVWAINTGAGSGNTLLSCAPATVLSGNPVGVVDRVAPLGAGTINIAGWALDPDTAASIPVAVYVDGVGVSWFDANRHRPDIAAAFTGYGSAHGFDISIPAGPGRHEVCVYAINSGPGTVNPLLSCAVTTVPTGNPIGVVDRAAFLGPNAINVVGWALDPDTAASIPVAVYVDGRGIGWFAADRYRPDLAVAFPGYGGAHAYNVTVPASPGTHQVCVYAINSGAGTGNPLLRCVTVSSG